MGMDAVTRRMGFLWGAAQNKAKRKLVMRIALTGNPNSGKTTMYNALTGRNEKVGTVINTALLAEKLGCPVVGTVSTDGGGLEQVIAATLALRGNGQKAPYTQGEIDLTDKRAVEEADRRRFAFVDHLVRQVETRRTLTREKGKGDAIDAVLTNRYLGIPIFAVVMFLVFQISQVWVGPLIADTLTAQLGAFQSWAGEQMAAASPLLRALLVDGIIAAWARCWAFCRW